MDQGNCLAAALLRLLKGAGNIRMLKDDDDVGCIAFQDKGGKYDIYVCGK